MNNLFNRPATPDAAAIRERIFNVLPAASYQMEKLFGLFDIEFSEETETAAVECRTTPRLLLNKRFLDKYCRNDGDLFLLILHELYHVILGHTRLFPRVTPIDNIVFDAVINSILSRTVGRTVGTSLFTRTNGYDSPPERLLRPPPGWPDECEGALASFPPEEQRIIVLLYGPVEPSEITYRDIYELLGKELAGRVVPNVLLLGSHGPEQHTAPCSRRPYGASWEAGLRHRSESRGAMRDEAWRTFGFDPPTSPVARSKKLSRASCGGAASGPDEARLFTGGK
jgi:hypothetical protein